MKFNAGVVIVCAGKGERLGKIDKPILDLGGKPLFYHAYSTFASLTAIKKIVLVLRKKHFPLAKRVIRDPRVVLVPGGRRRRDSVYNGLIALGNKINYVLIHDGARPAVSASLITQILKKLKQSPAVICGLKVNDTVKLTEGTYVTDTLNRKQIRLIQTPQGFKKDLLLLAYRKAKKKDTFDDAQLIEQAGNKVCVIAGETNNFKITYPADLARARLLYEGEYQIGWGFDIHKFKPPPVNFRKKIVLGGVLVPCRLAIDAVSDGDVILHALADGICGASNLGDIGDYFPPGARQSKNISSRRILKRILSKAQVKFNIINADITIISERPRLYPYKGKILASLGKLLPQVSLNLKIKSKEGLEILGGKESIVCMVNILVRRKA